MELWDINLHLKRVPGRPHGLQDLGVCFVVDEQLAYFLGRVGHLSYLACVQEAVHSATLSLADLLESPIIKVALAFLADFGKS